jgi:hypothetical protein
LDYAKISKKLLGPSRKWTGTRYYIGRVSNTSPSYADQRKFEARLAKNDARISIHFGRVEAHLVENEAAREMLNYLYRLSMRIDSRTFQELVALAKKHAKTIVWKEKAVDVQLAVDMVVMATRNGFDAAYLLSADGDFTGRSIMFVAWGKKVYAASPNRGAQLAKAVNSFIPLAAAWFDDCY